MCLLPKLPSFRIMLIIVPDFLKFCIIAKVITVGILDEA